MQKRYNWNKIYANGFFYRLVNLVKRCDDTELFFAYEMAPVPMSLFQDGCMRKPDKPALEKAIKECLWQLNLSWMGVVFFIEFDGC